ncbi:hypothetical protein FB479_10848 [Brevibacillus sp. AG162]|uniref:hypothetical protein n=1 Tax=Brevibacillus sp. AG162 TaxID=2572910 RepID=UPI00114DA8E3|nr:hypothetical protein [Brevibacillus sp. AG162]TQK53835.1 hypothetical protein FB479_10848 [Brevibacillus sp. AG162]
MSYQGDKTKITGRIELVSEDISRPTMATPQLFNDFLKKIANSEQAILDEFSSTAKQSSTLKHGLQVITTDRATPVNVLSIKGRTLVNLLGTRTYRTSHSNTVITPEPSIMDNTASQNVKTPSTTEGFVSFLNADTSRILIKAGKYYLFMADVKLNSRTSGVGVVKLGGDTGLDATPINMSNIGNWQIAKHKFYNTVDINGAIIAGICYANGVFAEVNFDIKNVRAYEVDKSTYDKIDVDPEYTGDKLAEKFPYVDSVQHLRNPYIKQYGKNLLPPFLGWALDSDTTIIEPYKLKHDVSATGVYRLNQYRVKIAEGQTLTFSSDIMISNLAGSGIALELYGYDKYGNYVAYVTSGFKASTGRYSVTYTPDSSIVEIVARLTADTNTTGTFTFTNPQLEIGSVATQFEPQNEEYQYLQTKLASNVEGKVYDSVFERDGQVFKLARFKEIILDGALDYKLQADKIGHKNITVLSGGGVERGAVHGTKFDGSTLDNITVGGFEIPDNVYMTGGGLYLTVKDTDTGWGEGYNPSDAEIKAFFNGWVMHDERNVNLSYTTGSRRWRKITLAPGDGQVNVDYNVETIPTTLVSGFTPYKLTYQLAEAVEEPITAEGSLSFHEGQNLVELAEGVIVRERANPIVRNELDYAQINTGSSSGSVSNNLKNRSNKILFIYKNGKVDNQWTLYSNYLGSSTANGGANATISYAHYDPTAVYEVTYITVDKHLLTSTALEASIQYATSDKSVLNEVVQQASDNETRLSVVETTYARKQQGQWIAPVLLNGWVNYGAGYSSAGYFKDDFGIVHLRGMIKGGTVGGTVPAFKLPAGYRPNVSHYFSASSYNGTIVFSSIEVGSNGYIVVSTGGNSWLSMDGITFRAEQ